MHCEVCGYGHFVAAEYATQVGRAPALECARCGALNLDENAASNDAELASVRFAALTRAGIVAERQGPAAYYAAVLTGRRARASREIGYPVIRFYDQNFSPLAAPGVPREALASAEAQRRVSAEDAGDGEPAPGDEVEEPRPSSPRTP